MDSLIEHMAHTIDFKGVGFSYLKGNPVFQDLNLCLSQQEWTVLVGHNGSGKTTLTKLLMGILKANSGEISIFGRCVKDLSLGQIGSMVGYVYQFPERQLFTSSVLEEVTFASVFRGEDPEQVNLRAIKVLQAFELDKHLGLNPLLLSIGEKRRLATAAILMNKPRYLILDEPTASLDVNRIKTLSTIIEQLKSENIGGLIISHDYGFVEAHGQRFMQLDKGRIIKDER